jgi:phosphate transport system protein
MVVHSTRTAFDREYGQICDELVKMSQMVDWAIEKALEALVEHDHKLAEQVVENDAQVNAMRFQIEEACLVAIATQQPAASDLRAVIAATHVAVEMERMGDYARGIAKTVILMEEEPLLKTFKKYPRMAELSRRMLAESIQAFLKRDAAWAQEIAAKDAEVDELYQSLFHKLVDTMAKEPKLVARATYMIWAAHNLERIADRVTNIDERIIFMTTGNLQEIG